MTQANQSFILHAQNIHKYYKLGQRKIHILRGINISIKPQEFVAIMGPSGSGKSTLMHIIGLLDKFDKGKLFIENKDVNKLHDNELAEFRGKKIGFIFQNFYLLSKYNVLDNVLLPTEYIYIEKAKEKAKEILESVGLKDRIYHKPNQLSGGQRQRVAIARALITTPKILLADEPTGNLDSKTGVQIMNLFKKLNQNGHTVIIITHDPEIAKWADRTIYIRDGEIYK